MTYRIVNGESAIALAVDMFNISISDWVMRSPYWIIEALDDTKVLTSLPVISAEITGDDYIYTLPCDLKSIVKVTYKNYIIPQHNNVTNDTNNLREYLVGASYTVNGDNTIRITSADRNLKDGTIKVYYRGYITQLSELYNVEMPLIPDDETLLQAIAHYILLRLLMRGYKHPIYSLNSNNQITNPYILYHGIGNTGGLKQKARNSVKSMSKEEYLALAGKLNSIVVTNRSNTIDFNGTM